MSSWVHTVKPHDLKKGEDPKLDERTYSRSMQVAHNIRVKTGVEEVVRLPGPLSVLHSFSPFSRFEHSPDMLLDLNLIPSSVSEWKANSLINSYGLMPLKRSHNRECFLRSDVGIFFQGPL
jgi:hypothetical protein